MTTSSGTQQEELGISVAGSNGHWTGPVVLERSPSGSVEQINAVSCPSVGSCMAIDIRGHALRYENGHWLAPMLVANQAAFTDIDCLRPLSCVAVASRPYFSSNGSSWLSGPQLQTTTSNGMNQAGGLAAVGCWQVQNCLTVDDMGDAYVEQNGVWSPGVVIAPNDNSGASPLVTKQLDSVACPGPGPGCLVADSTGRVWTWENGTWSSPHTVDPSLATCVARAEANGGNGACSSQSALYLSCPNDAWCAAVDTIGNVLFYHSGAWSSPRRIDPRGFSALSCPEVGKCIAADNSGRVLSITNASG